MIEGSFYWSLHLVRLRLVDKVRHPVFLLLSGNNFLGLLLADLQRAGYLGDMITGLAIGRIACGLELRETVAGGRTG